MYTLPVQEKPAEKSKPLSKKEKK